MKWQKLSHKMLCYKTCLLNYRYGNGYFHRSAIPIAIGIYFVVLFL